MAKVEYIIPNVIAPLQQAAGGIAYSNIARVKQKDAVKQIFYPETEVFELEEAEQLGPLGHPVFMPFVLNRKLKTIDGKSGIGENLFIPCTVVDIALPKNIVKTMIQGRNTSVKEYISDGDFEISVKGILVGEEEYPWDLVKLLDAYTKLSESIDVDHDLMTKLGCYAIVIEKVNWVATPGFENIQAFELQCVSDLYVQIKN